jgi:Tol biopolymer transport system component
MRTLSKPEDLFVIRSDGTDLRKLTDDAYKDRGPRWTPDSQWIIFYSERSGRYDYWRIKPDGSGLQQIVKSSGSFTGAPSLLSPDGKEILNSGMSGFQMIDISGSLPSTKFQTIAGFPIAGQYFFAVSWSPDGKKIAGRIVQQTVNRAIYTYTFDTKAYEKMADIEAVAAGLSSIFWLKDSRRIVYVDQQKFWVVDTETRKPRALGDLDPEMAGFRISSDNRTLYYVRNKQESDVWLLQLK